MEKGVGEEGVRRERKGWGGRGGGGEGEEGVGEGEERVGRERKGWEGEKGVGRERKRWGGRERGRREGGMQHGLSDLMGREGGWLWICAVAEIYDALSHLYH